MIFPAAIVATQQPIVGSIVKFRSPVFVNNHKITPGQRGGLELRVDDRLRCDKGGAVSVMLGDYAADLPCPFDYQIPYVARGSDPGAKLKAGAKIGFSPVPLERAGYSPCGSGMLGEVAKGAADEPNTRYSGVTCDCPAEVENGLLCIKNTSAAAIWYVRVIASGTSGSPEIQLLRPYQHMAQGQVWQWYVPVNSRTCSFAVSAEFENGTTAVWRSANLCLSAPESHEWDITGPGPR